MRPTTLTRASLALLVGIAIASGLAGCGSGTSKQPEAGAPAPAASEIARMTAELKRSAIATSFPIEVPVPQGRVVRGEAQGADVWVYQLEIPATAADVVDWYATWYPKAEWVLIKDEQIGEGRRLIFTKGGYAADVNVTPAGSSLTKVTATVGMGDPILNTQ